MFYCLEKSLSPNTLHFQIKKEKKLLTFAQVIELWKNNPDFRLFYSQILRKVPFAAFFWENKAVTLDSLDLIYEFVIVGTTAFEGKIANDSPFSNYFIPNIEVVSFPNLGNNAQLVVPCPVLAQKEHYTHLASFIRKATEDQIDDFWKLIGIEFSRVLNQKPTWLSTSGLGVYWLHARLDQSPKYYTYLPYKKP